ncbi:MAG: sensor histidine kinase [Nitrospirae bacterium]|nr:MAG: sensor histidine kinase [Nitrospirota bacterium]
MLKEKFLAITSHELKTPVTILSALTDLLLADGDDLSREESRELLDRLAEVARSLREIVEGMHDLALAREGGISLHREPLDLGSLLAEVVEAMALEGRERGVAVELEVARPWPAYLGDATRLRRAVRQLVRNGIQYTPDGGRVAVRLDAWQPRAGGEEGPAITVADTGIGIEEEERRLVFDTFYEAADTDHHHTSATAFQGGGLGIGLSMVLEVVTAHGGRITLDSEPGEGTTVRLLLPPPSEAERACLEAGGG